MSEKHVLIAFCSTLGAIVVLFALSALCLWAGRSVEAIGIGGVMTGLIGVLGTFRPSSKANVGTADTANVGKPE